MEEKLEIFYIRHGNTDVTKLDGRDTCDVDLSEQGEKEILLLGERFKGKNFDAVFSSPLVRAVKTAGAVCEQLDGSPVIEILPQIIENGSSYGYFGQDIEYLKKYYPDITLNNDLPLMFDNLEDEDNDARADAVIRYLRNRFTFGQKVLVVAHGSFGNHFIPRAVNMGNGDYIFSLNNTSVTKIKYTPDGKQRISFSNDFSHLRPIMPNYEFEV